MNPRTLSIDWDSARITSGDLGGGRARLDLTVALNEIPDDYWRAAFNELAAELMSEAADELEKFFREGGR